MRSILKIVVATLFFFVATYAVAWNVAPASGAIGNSVNGRYNQCMDEPWEKWWRPDLKYAQCVGEGYGVLFEQSGIGSQLLNTPHRWIPHKGKLTIDATNNFILVQFMFDDEAIDFFKTKFIGSNTRLPIGLEIDVSPTENDVFHKKCAVLGVNLPDEAGLFTDTTADDWNPGCGAVIRNPHKLVSGTYYAIAFYADGLAYLAPWQGATLIQESGPVVLNFQVSVDKTLANGMIAAYDSNDHQLNGFPNDGGGDGFDYFVTASDTFSEMNVPSKSLLCWYAKSGDDIDCDGGDPFHHEVAENIVAANGSISSGLISSGDVILSDGNVSIPDKGPGGASTVTDTPVELPPDFIVNKTWLVTPWGVETYKFGLNESFDTKAQSKNIGDGQCVSGEIDTITGHFYLSRGYKEDVHSGDGAWRRVDSTTTQCDNLKPGDTHTETKNTVIGQWITEPGIYNIVYCIDHPQDDHNNGGDHQEKHESNNCSTEAVFEVTANPVENQDPRFVDFVTSGLQFRQAPYYAGDHARFGATVTNQGNIGSPSDIRSSYSVQCPGTGLVYLADDGTMASTLSAGASAFEENIGPVTLPNVAGTCTAYFCADYQGAVTESDEGNNCTSLSFVLQPRPKPKLVITKFQDEVGCCTTNRGSRIKPDIWVRNDGPVAPASDVTVLYHISSPVATGGAWWNIGYGVIRPSELPPGGTDEDYMEGNGWPIPSGSAWKLQWHAVRACLKQDGSTPVGDPNTEVCAYYARYSKK